MTRKTTDGWAVTLRGNTLRAQHRKYGDLSTNLALAGSIFHSTTQTPIRKTLPDVLHEFAFMLEQAQTIGNRRSGR